MSTRRRFGTAFIAGIAALSLLTSCSGGASKSSSGSEEKLTFMMLGASQKSIEHIEKNVLPEFKKKTGVTVTLQTSDWGVPSRSTRPQLPRSRWPMSFLSARSGPRR